MEVGNEDAFPTYTLWQCVLKILNVLCNFWRPVIAIQLAAALSFLNLDVPTKVYVTDPAGSITVVCN